MKLTPMILALISPLAAHAAPVQLGQICELKVRAAVAAVNSGDLLPDEKTGDVTLEKFLLDEVKISNVKVIKTECLGPADCDAQNPDAFTYSANIGKKGDGAYGKVVVFYHRGHCGVEKINIAY